MENKLTSKDFYCVYNDFDISLRTRELNLLYLPLIGSEAVRLYQFLGTKITGDKNISGNFLHYDIFDNLMLDSTKFNIARKKLEAIGLLYTYFINSDGVNQYLYKIRSALDFNEFFEIPALDQLLENTIGLKQYNDIKNKYGNNKLNFKNFENLTAKFSEVFTLENLDDYSFENMLEKTATDTPNFDEYYFAFSKLNYLLANSYLSELLDDKSIKSSILGLAHLYKVTPNDMAKAIEKSVNTSSGTMSLDMNLLKDYLLQLFINVRKQEIPILNKMINKKLLEEDVKEELTREEKFIKEVDNINYVEYLNKQRGIILSEANAKSIVEIQNKYNFPTGVLNILLDYAISESNGDGVPHKNYIDAIASSWSSQKLLGARDAIKYARRSRDNRKKSSKNNKKRDYIKNQKQSDLYTAPVPEYFKDRIENLSATDNNISVRTVTSEDEDAYKKMLAELYKKGDNK